MRRIGDRALPFRLPAVGERGLTLIDPSEFLGRWIVLSFVSALKESDADLWDEEGRLMQALGAALLVVPLEEESLHPKRFHAVGRTHFTIVGGRVARVERRRIGGRWMSLPIRECDESIPYESVTDDVSTDA